MLADNLTDQIPVQVQVIMYDGIAHADGAFQLRQPLCWQSAKDNALLDMLERIRAIRQVVAAIELLAATDSRCR
jgi:hypothetical protein